jgi:hypothetical protein
LTQHFLGCEANGLITEKEKPYMNVLQHRMEKANDQNKAIFSILYADPYFEILKHSIPKHDHTAIFSFHFETQD